MSIIVPGRKLGRLPYRHDPRTLRFGDLWYRAFQPPPQADWTGRVTVPWGMLLNDQLGDCAIAGAAHEIMAWTFVAGDLIVPTDPDVVAAYSAVSGYDGTPQTDTGCVLLDVLKYWRNTGISGQKIGAFASIRPGNFNHLKAAVAYLEGVYGGWNLPDAWLNAPQGQTWDAGDGVTANPDNGHCMPMLGYDADGVLVVTWGYVQRITWAGVSLALDEAWAIVSTDMLDPATGKTPAGLDAAALNNELSVV